MKAPCALFHSRVQQPCKFIGTNESLYMYVRKELNSHRIGLVHQHGCRVILLEHQYGCHDVMCMRSTVRNMEKVLVSFAAILPIVVSSGGSFFGFHSCLPSLPLFLPSQLPPFFRPFPFLTS